MASEYHHRSSVPTKNYDHKYTLEKTFNSNNCERLKTKRSTFQREESDWIKFECASNFKKDKMKASIYKEEALEKSDYPKKKNNLRIKKMIKLHSNRKT